MKHCLLTMCIVIASFGTSANAQSSPYCNADLVFDNKLDFFDISTFITYYSINDLTVDFDGSGNLDFYDVSAFMLTFAGGCPDLTDSDNDRLPDFVETNDGKVIDAFTTGTDPFNADTDNDGLEDGDEVLGTNQGLVLPNASPIRRDLYIECDWFEGVFQGRSENYRPTTSVVNRVVAAFANAPTDNPYGNPMGISIHLDYGQGNGHTGGNQLPGSPDVIFFDSEFNEYKADHFDPRRKGYYHYAIFANRYNSSSNGSSGIAEINGDDFMVTMVNYNSTNNMSNTIVHELGHNLGLRHGGFENRNNKPNYNSVMNYRHQFPGIDTTGDSRGDGVLDYSSGININLDESALDENNGVNGFDPIDWNRNGFHETSLIAANINCSSVNTWRECGSGSGCYDSTCNLLRDHDDWNTINWNRLNQSLDRLPEQEMIKCQNWPGK